jgi:hypothetical protein
VHRTLCRIATVLCLLSATLIGGFIGCCGGLIALFVLVGLSAMRTMASPDEPDPGGLPECFEVVPVLGCFAMPPAGAVFDAWTCAQALKRRAADRRHPRPMAAPGDDC